MTRSMNSCIFCKIAHREIPKEFTYEDEEIMVFPDIHPAKPVHLLIIPKKHIADFMAVHDDTLWSKIRTIAQKMVEQFDLNQKGFRLSTNGGGAQQIDHFHLHLLGPMGRAV